MANKPYVTDRASLELLYDISREFAAALDLRTVLHRVLMMAMKTVGAVSGSIIVLDDLGQPVDSAFLLSGQPHDQNTLRLRLTYERGLAGWVGRERRSVLIQDTSKDERWLQRPDDSLERTGPKSAISAPILAREQLVGVITLVHPKPGFFTPDHLELFEAVADQAGVAILNARLYAESQRQAQVMTAVAESAAMINALLSLDEILNRILELVIQALGVQGTFLALVDADSDDLEVRAAVRDDLGPIQAGFSTASEASIIGKRIPSGKGIAGWVTKEGLGAIINDTRGDKRFSPAVDQILGFQSNAVLAAPIRSEGQSIGVLEVINPKESAFEPDDLLVMMGIGSLAGTAIRRAELYERVQAAHKRYQELFEDSIDLILITDGDGKVLEANRRALQVLNLKVEQLHSLTIDELHLIDWEKVGRKFMRLETEAQITSPPMVSYESILNFHTARKLPVQVYVRRIVSGGLTQLQWILRDISERKDLDRLREDMIAMIYHDLRSPLANVVSSLEILSLQSADAPGEAPGENLSASSLLKVALRSTERIQRLTDTLLDINRLEADQPFVTQQAIAPGVLVDDAVEVIMPAVKSKEINFQVNVPKGLPDIWVDVDMIRRVIINLLENAAKFTLSKGSMGLTVSLDDGYIHLVVWDSGPGIADEDRERIFNKFTRLNFTNGPRGLGLGLAFCRLAVTRHGGQIWVESQVGSGSNFHFTLPVVSELFLPGGE